MHRLIVTNQSDFYPLDIDVCEQDYDTHPKGTKFCHPINFGDNTYQQKHLYYFEPYDTSLCILDDESKLVKFTKKFGITPDGGKIFTKQQLKDPLLINWQHVAQYYDGIELVDIQPHVIERFYWLQDWNVPGGYVWDTSVIQKLSRLTVEDLL